MKKRVILAAVMIAIWFIAQLAMPPYFMMDPAEVHWYTENP